MMDEIMSERVDRLRLRRITADARHRLDALLRTGGFLGDRPRAPCVAERICKRHAAGRANLRTRAGGGSAGRMFRLGNGYRPAAEFDLANGAIDDFVIRALCRTRRGDFVFPDRLSRRMGSRNGFLFREDDAADGTLAAFRKPIVGAGRSLPRNDLGRMRGHRDALRTLRIAARTCIGANARCRTGGRRRHRTAAPCMTEGCRLHMLTRYFFLADRTIDDLVIRARLRTSRSLFVFFFRL